MRSSSGDGSSPMTERTDGPYQRQIESRSDADFQHSPFGGADHPLAERMQRRLPHRQMQQRRHHMALIETHPAGFRAASSRGAGPARRKACITAPVVSNSGNAMPAGAPGP